MCGQVPPIHLPYLSGKSNIELVDRSLVKREEMLKVIKLHLKMRKKEWSKWMIGTNLIENMKLVTKFR